MQTDAQLPLPLRWHALLCQGSVSWASEDISALAVQEDFTALPMLFHALQRVLGLDFLCHK